VKCGKEKRKELSLEEKPYEIYRKLR